MAVRSIMYGVQLTFLGLSGPLGVLLAQQPAIKHSAVSTVSDPAFRSAGDRGFRSDYVLGPNDQLVIRTSDIDDVERTVRISSDGYVSIPLAGRVLATGQTAQQLEVTLTERLKPFVKQPQVWVDVTEFHSQPVSIIGAVRNPGVYQLEGKKTLVDMISLAGGVREDAGHSIIITRYVEWGPIPLPVSSGDPAGKFYAADVPLKDITEARKPEENVEVKPHDVISVPRASLVYVVGEVKKSGGFVLSEQENVSVLQALSLAEGLAPNAAPHRARILRPDPAGGERTEIPVDVKQILAGKSSDLLMRAGDILFIPNSVGRQAAVRAIEAAIQTGSGLLIWGTVR